MSRNLNQHVKSDKIKWTIAFISILMIAIFAVGLSLQLFGRGKQKPSEWFNNTDDSVIDIEEVADSSFIVTPYNSNENIALTSLALPMAETDNRVVRRLTVTVHYGDNIERQAPIDWTLAFVNSESEWATGKIVTDYVTVTPTEDGALMADVECLNAFGEQIKVIATLRDNKNLYASCTVDYKQKINAVNAEFAFADTRVCSPYGFRVGTKESNGITELNFSSISPSSLFYNAKFNPTRTGLTAQKSTVYTIASNVEFKCSMKMNYDFLAFAITNLHLSNSFGYYGNLVAYEDIVDGRTLWNDVEIVSNRLLFSGYLAGNRNFLVFFFGRMLSRFRADTKEQYDDYTDNIETVKLGWNELFSAFDLYSKSTSINEEDKYNFSIKFECTIDGVTTEYIQNFLINYTYPASDITMDDSNIIF